MAQDIISRIGKLLSLAEKAATEAEAEAAMAKAQALSTQHQVDLELARTAHTMSGAKPVPEIRRIVLGEHRKMGLSTYVELLDAIARPNNVRLTVARDSTWVNAYGFNDDIDLVEQLYASLVTQMVTASNAYIRSGAHRNEVREPTSWFEDPKPVSGRTARISFQEAFARRIGRRLREAKRETLATMTAARPTASTSAELVLVGRQNEVEKFYADEIKHIRGSWKGNQGRSHSTLGARAGDAAGQRARIGASTAIGGQRTAISA